VELVAVIFDLFCFFPIISERKKEREKAAAASKSQPNDVTIDTKNAHAHTSTIMDPPQPTNRNDLMFVRLPTPTIP